MRLYVLYNLVVVGHNLRTQRVGRADVVHDRALAVGRGVDVVKVGVALADHYLPDQHLRGDGVAE